MIGNSGQTLLVPTMDSLHPEMWKRSREFEFNSKANNLKPPQEKLSPTATGVQALLGQEGTESWSFDIEFRCKEKRGNSEPGFQAKLSFAINSDKENFKLNLKYAELAIPGLQFKSLTNSVIPVWSLLEH